MTQEKREFEDWLSCARQAKRVALLAHISRTGTPWVLRWRFALLFGAGQAG